MHEDIPESGDYDNGDEELLRHEDEVLKEIEGVFEPDPLMPAEDELVILDFLNRFNVRQAQEASHETLSIIWASLSRNPSVVKDFTYVISDVNASYNYSEYPLPISIEDIVEWCDELKGRESSIRMWLVDETVVPNIVRLGFEEDKVRQDALGEFHGLPRTGEAVRFLGWLVGQKFISGAISNELSAYLERKAITEPELSHLAMVTEMMVRRELKHLNGRSKMYKRSTSMVERAQSVHEDMVFALEGINNMCQDLFHEREIS